MKQVVLPAVIAACVAAMAYAAGPQAPVQLTQVQYKDTPQGTYKMDKGAAQGTYKMDPGQGGYKMDKGATQNYKMDKGAGQGAYKMERGAGEYKGASPQGQPQYQRPDKDYKGQGGLYGQQKTDPAYGQQKMGPGGPGGGFGQDAFHK